jgi:Icc-related predicted phosphoesterase
VRLAAISDLHGFLPETPPCDVLLIAGDVCPVSDHELDFQRRWLETEFARWLAQRPAETILGIAGNHDFVAEVDDELMRSLPWHYLLDETTRVDGLTIHGSPWTVTFMDWAFMRSEAELAPVWAKIPEETDILVTHGPPYGHGDLVINGNRGGSETLLRRMEELPQLQLHICGHVHEGGGTRSQVGTAEVVNVSYVDFDYRPAREATVFELS